MRLRQHTFVIGVPDGDAIIQAAFGRRVELFQPFHIPADLILAVQFKDAAQLAVGGGVEGVRGGAVR